MPAYSITEVEVLDPNAHRRYVEVAGAAVARYGGRFLVRGAEPRSPRASGRLNSASSSSSSPRWIG
jgi:uncharacterized protein (DUF1330 family)